MTNKQQWNPFPRRAFLKFLAASPLLAYAPVQALFELSKGASVASGAERIIGSSNDAVDLFDFEAVARSVLPPAHFDYLSWGVEAGATVQHNRDGFARIELRPRRLVDVTHVDTSTELFGQRLKAPILISPTGSEKAFHPDGAIAAAKAARAKDYLQILSTVSNSSIEEVTQATGRPLWFQLYATGKWSASQALLKRAEAAGCPVVAVTVDLPAGRSVRDIIRRSKYTDSRKCLDCHEWNIQGYARQKPMLNGIDLSGGVNAPQLTWDTVRQIKDSTRMKVVLKGIVTREDAELCLQHGVDGIIVSNHGGRSEGYGRSTIECLPEVVAGTKGRIPVLIDGGIRRGSDIFKALALGAHAVCIGRPYLWGMASFGQAGVEAVLDILHEELELQMRMCGTTSIKKITAAHVRVA